MAELTQFGQRIAKAQKLKNWKDSDLARKLNIASPNISTMKYKTVNPRAATVSKLARLFDLPEQFFLEDASSAPRIILRKAPKANESIIETNGNPDGVLPGQLPLTPNPESFAATSQETDTEVLKVFVVFEFGGKIVSKKQIKRLPADFEF